MTDKAKILEQKDIDAWETDENGMKTFPESSIGLGCKFDDGYEFGNDFKSFPAYSKFDDGCEFGKNCKFGTYCEFGVGCVFDNGCKFGDGCQFGNVCKFYGWCQFGNDCKFGGWCHFDNDCKFGDRCQLGNCCKLGVWCDFGDDCQFGGKCEFPAYYMDGRMVNTCMFGNHCTFMQEVKTENEKQGNTQPKFTPGPWHKKGKRVFWQKPEPDLPKDNLFNGLVCICATTEDNPPEVIEEACANAALIAQAPKMLKTLKKCLAFLQRCPMTRNVELESEIETILEEATK